MWGSSVWGFSESTVRGEGVSLLAVARALRVHTVCKRTSAVCRENADCVYFSPEPAGSGGGEREAGAARPKLAFRSGEHHRGAAGALKPAAPARPSFHAPAVTGRGQRKPRPRLLGMNQDVSLHTCAFSSAQRPSFRARLVSASHLSRASLQKNPSWLLPLMDVKYPHMAASG